MHSHRNSKQLPARMGAATGHAALAAKSTANTGTQQSQTTTQPQQQNSDRHANKNSHLVRVGVVRDAALSRLADSATVVQEYHTPLRRSVAAHH